MALLMTLLVTTMKAIAEAIRFGVKSRQAWWFTASSRTRERFERTTLGNFWLGLSSLLSVGVLSAVYGSVFQTQDIKSYIVYIGIGISTWNTIAASTQSAPNLFHRNRVSLKNTGLHPIFYSLQEWAFQVQVFAQSFSPVLVVLAILQPSLIWHLCSAALLPLINLLLFIYWFPLLLCLLGARFEDLYQLVPIILQLLFLSSPILFKKDLLGAMKWIADLNPLYQVLSDYRDALILGEPRFYHSLAITGINLCGLLISVWLLVRNRYKIPFWV